MAKRKRYDHHDVLKHSLAVLTGAFGLRTVPAHPQNCEQFVCALLVGLNCLLPDQRRAFFANAMPELAAELSRRGVYYDGFWPGTALET